MTDNTAQMASPSYRLASMTRNSCWRLHARRAVRWNSTRPSGLRWGVRSTLVVFGSARMPEDGSGAQSELVRQAREFGPHRLGARRRADAHAPLRDNVIATGGGPGIMEAANRGAADAGAPSIGFNIALPREQEPNTYSTPTLTFRFHYFAMRKMHLAMRANALVVFPGGFGTMDELFEMLTLRQTGKAPRIAIVLADRDYWPSVINFDAARPSTAWSMPPTWRCSAWWTSRRRAGPG